MRNLFLIISLLLTGLFSYAERVEPYQGSRLFWDTTTQRTVFASGGYARIIQLQDGRLMACCESGGIRIAFSEDMGNSWSNATKIASNPQNISECVPDMIQLSDGTIIVAYNPRPHSPYSEDRLFGIRCKRSTDNGKTWSEEIFVNDAHHTFEDGCWEPAMIELPSGEVQLYFADEGPYTTSGEQQISMCRSFDKGKTWGTPEKICFRAGTRDGMPVPLLLKDESEIVVIIEDNGWGYGDFFPTTVRCPLTTNWNNYWVDAASSNRERTLDFNFCPLATGGAPYIRQMQNGETVMSYQSAYNNEGKLRMLVAVGDESARHFKNLSQPFANDTEHQGLWNSLAIIDDGSVVAVSGLLGSIQMIKGYAKSQFECNYGHPTIDGDISAGEGYSTENCAQVRMGWTNGNQSLHDFAYDEDSLYYCVRVRDVDQITSGTNVDGVRLYVDALNTSDDKPAVGTYQYNMKLSGAASRLVGHGQNFRTTSSKGYRMTLSNDEEGYVMELAVAWSDMGLNGAPVGKRIAVNMEVRQSNGKTVVSEFVPDAQANAPWTWMTLRLGALPEDSGISQTKATSKTSNHTYDLTGRVLPTPLHNGICIRNGRKVLRF